jgi:hypothetical protein
MVWLVCGGRAMGPPEKVFEVLNKLALERGLPTLVLTGGATGADTWGLLWAKRKGVVRRSFPADWGRHGKRAGMQRNQIMLDAHKVDLVVAFPGGAGTADMVRRSREANVEVVVCL